MILYSDSARLCRLLVRMQSGETLTKEETDSVVSKLVLCRDGLVEMFTIASWNSTISPEQVLDHFLTTSKDVMTDFEALSLARELVAGKFGVFYDVWLNTLISFLADRYASLELDWNVYCHLNKATAKKVKLAPPPRYSATIPTYSPEQLSPEQYDKKIAEYAGDMHQSWVLAKNHGKIREAIDFLWKGHSYSTLSDWSRDDEYRGYFQKEEIERIFEEGVIWHKAQADEKRNRDGEAYRNTSGYWKVDLILAGCLERDRRNFEQAAELYRQGGQIDRAARLAIRENLPQTNKYVVEAVESQYWEFVPLLRDIDSRKHTQTLQVLEKQLEEAETDSYYSRAVVLARAMEDTSRAAVYYQASRFFERELR